MLGGHGVGSRLRHAFCVAGISSSTDASSSPLSGKTVVVVGAGGAGRALAFGAAVKGAAVIIANRSVQKAAELAAQVGLLLVVGYQ